MPKKKRVKKSIKRAAWRRNGKRGKPQRKRRARAAKAPWRTHGDGSRLLAFDVSSVVAGWAFFENGKLTQHGKQKLAGKSHDERLAGFLVWLANMFERLHPTEVAYEAPFQGRHRNAFAVLSMYRAAMHAAHWQVFARPLQDVNQLPAHLIKRVLGVPHLKGGTTEERHAANKRVVVKAINGMYGTAFQFVEGDDKTKRSDDDIADAVAVGHSWYALHVDTIREGEDTDE